MNIWAVPHIQQISSRRFKPLSTIFQLYHGINWISYQYYLSIYPDTSQSFVMTECQGGQPLLPSLWFDPAGDQISLLQHSIWTLYHYTTKTVRQKQWKTQNESITIEQNWEHCVFYKVFNPFQLVDRCWSICSWWLLNTLWQKEKFLISKFLLVTVYQLFQNLYFHFSRSSIIVCRCPSRLLQISSKGERVNGLKYFQKK